MIWVLVLAFAVGSTVELEAVERIDGRLLSADVCRRLALSPGGFGVRGRPVVAATCFALDPPPAAPRGDILT